MTLTTIINKQKNQLYKELEEKQAKLVTVDLDNLKYSINLVTEILDDLTKDVANLRYIETKEILNLLYDNIDVKQEKAYMEEQIRIIKLIFNAKYDEHLELDVTDNQSLFLEDLKKNLSSLKLHLENEFSNSQNQSVSSQEEIDALQDDIINFEIIHEKIISNQKELLTLDDFQVLYKIVENPKFSYKMKKDLLIAIKRYNSDSKKNSNEQEVADINSIKKLFEKYGVDKKIFKYIDKCRIEIEANADLDNIREILDYLTFEDITVNKRNILSSFDLSTLLAITVYGSLESVQNAYEKIINSGNNAKMFFETAGVWINNLPKERNRKKRNGNRAKADVTNLALYTQAHEISYEEILKNERFLKEKGFNVSMNQPGNSRLLKTPNYKIEENYDICRLYSLFIGDKHDFSTSTLWFSSLAETCDKFIELGLLHCPDAETYPYADLYICKYPTIMNTMREATIALLYKLKGEMSAADYYKVVFSQKRPGMLAGDLTKKNLGYDLKDEEKVNQFKKKILLTRAKRIYTKLCVI